ncbi:hydrolase [Actinopolymorpha rutila]|uniref:Beta-phosphoglucomutase-like phosphatase (HAD superfamily) n=1 Tax=Actinopolymorpha rutila TaxID=446787 RepID=A0A852ZC15_9ACTN|nr:hydrolase [Actinopolymorpha rutila]NYH90454.1 beta-phosphoglucomutase-like phosphatase (HAD superfamily) [Actinopolymorpha rutila]
MTSEPTVLRLDRIGAVVFEVDVVVPDTARAHAAAWKRCLDAFLRRHGRMVGVAFAPFDVREDYLRHFAGRPRIAGLRGFLADRGIDLPDNGAENSVSSLADCEMRSFLTEIARYGVPPNPVAVRLLYELRARGARTAAVCTGGHCAEIVAAAQVRRLFDAVLDSARAGADQGAADGGRAVPARVFRGGTEVFAAAARQLAIPPAQAGLLVASADGERAGRRAGFGTVLAVAGPNGSAASVHSATPAVAGDPGSAIPAADLAQVRVFGRRREPFGIDL